MDLDTAARLTTRNYDQITAPASLVGAQTVMVTGPHATGRTAESQP